MTLGCHDAILRSLTRLPLWLLGIAAPAFAQLAVSPPSLDFGGQSMGTTSPALTLTVTNTGSGTATVASVTHADSQFGVTHNCTSLAPAASCTIQVTFSPTAAPGDLNATAAVSDQISIASDAPGSPKLVALAGTSERSLVTHFYRSILRRAPDLPGKLYWTRESFRLRDLGANTNEAWYAMAAYFYFSAEYASSSRTDAQFVTDVYATFFNRAPDAPGFDFWTGQLGSGLPREVALAAFMFSTEFATFTQAIFGPGSSRPEIDVVMDFYRGMLARLAEDNGLVAWAESLRAVQCGAATAVAARAQAEAIANAFVPEHANRQRNNAQYVGDLYNALLRRGGDLEGVNYWINQLATSARTRAQVRSAFMDSNEFGARLQALIARPCISHGTASTFAQSSNSNSRRQSIEIGADGLPVVGFWSLGPLFELRFVRCGNDSCAAGNSEAVLLSTNGSIFVAPAMAIGADGLPVLSYEAGFETGGLRVLKCGNASCSAGNVQTVVGSAFLGPTVAIGPGGLPLLAFTRQERGGSYTVNALACASAPCSSGSMTTTLIPAAAGIYNLAGDVRFGADALPAVPATNGGVLRLVKCGNAECSSGNAVRDLAGNAAAGAPAMRMGADGFPTIVYPAFDGNGGPIVQVAKCSDASCASPPTISTILAYNNAINQAIALPADGLPILVMEPAAGSRQARVVKCGNAACSAGNTVTTLGGFGNRVTAPSVAIGSAGLPVIVFLDGADRVRVLACANAACTSN